jgi:hypothetical protein
MLLAVAVEINFAEQKEVIQRCDVLPQSSPQSKITIFDADLDLLEASCGCFGCLTGRKQARPLAPLIRQEIFYRLLSGASGSRLGKGVTEVTDNDKPLPHPVTGFAIQSWRP